MGRLFVRLTPKQAKTLAITGLFGAEEGTR